MVVEQDHTRGLRSDSVNNHSTDCDGTLMAKFYCGVVEGFYGRPWTTEQRKRLFKRMQMFGMDTYLYAPKDDCKHRMYWRDLYSVEEADHLTGLIDAAAEHGISFVYALSPGLDIGYSNSKELACLKRKLEQVSAFGCKAFALLFDDIDVDMNEADKAIYQSFAQAQVAVTNEVYQHLHEPKKFLFCPTEYCSSRAVPNVLQSEYLSTIGSKLLPAIDIMWTGPRVVSKTLTMKHIKQISDVFRRPPVIWDNIHANDYDQKRLFLGPYEGRPTEIIPHLRGVMTNPNCEFEANYIAIHTLGQWAKSSPMTSDAGALLGSSPVSSDIKLETEGDVPEDLVSDSYRPKEALHKAIKEWQSEFHRHCSAATVISTVVSSPPIAEPTSPIPIPTSANTVCCVTASGVRSPDDVNLSLMQPKTVALANSLVSHSNDSDVDSATELCEPMDCVNTSVAAGGVFCPTIENASLKSSLSGYDSGIADTDFAEKLGSSEQMQIDTDTIPAECLQDTTLSSLLSDCRTCTDTMCAVTGPIICEDVHLLVELFYMPFEHGSMSVKMLCELQWLLLNCSCLVDAKVKDATEETMSRCQEWNDRACLFRTQLKVIVDTLNRLQDIPNKAILHDICSYIWDLRTILSITDAFIAWLALECVPSISVYYLQGNPYTWGNNFYRDAFQSGDQEPWMFRGGLQGELQRLLPLDGVVDLLVTSTPAFDIACKMLTVRPYRVTDEAAVYEVCRRTCDDGLDSTDIFPSHPDLVADRHIGGFLSCSPEYCFVLEDGPGKVLGYAVACLDALEFYKKMVATWVPAMQIKYPRSEKTVDLSPAEEMITVFHNYKAYTPEALLTRFPSMIRVDLLPEGKEDPTAHRRLLATAVAALRTNGSQGIYTELQVGDQNMIDACTKLQFYTVPLTDIPEDRVILGRII